MSDARLRLAFAGLHPDRLRSMLAEHGPEGAVRRVERSRSDHARSAVAVAAEARRRELHAMGIRFLPRGDPHYPAHLAHRPDAPDGLFVRGTLPAAPGVAVVGTRRCTEYGRRLAHAYGRAIAVAGWPLVSGLARGIDGAAHRGTVAGGGVGVAVLGCGPDIFYPREHLALAGRLLDLGGAVVTEYPPGTPPEGWRFPPRNRVISGLSAAVVVVEAPVRGGALITAGYALEHGVAVFAVPGDVDRESSRGCNLLIRDGAHPVLDPADLVAELELVLGPVAALTSPDGTTGGHDRAAGLPSEGMSLDELAYRLSLTAAEVAARVTIWESAGVAERRGDRVYPRPA